MRPPEPPLLDAPRLRALGLFAGIGGFEIGFTRQGISPVAFCEIDEAARAVLKARFPNVPCYPDVSLLEELPDCEVLTAGFPCQDLSQAGPLAGIKGRKSGLVSNVFRLLRDSERTPDWVIFENVPFMLSLNRGAGMDWLVAQLEALNMRWAYRVVNSQAFGLPQRRRRLYLVASRHEDPAAVLFADDTVPKPPLFDGIQACGFYWTEGNTGLGWAVDAVPPLKGSSGIGIISPPAVWLPGEGRMVTPTITVAEQLQGLPANWTKAAEAVPRGDRYRWRLVGNAVSPPVAEWLAFNLQRGMARGRLREVELCSGERWPRAARGDLGRRFAVNVSEWPVALAGDHLRDMLGDDSPELSLRASRGFQRRLLKSSLRVSDGFKADLASHVERSERTSNAGDEPSDVSHARARQRA